VSKTLPKQPIDANVAAPLVG